MRSEARELIDLESTPEDEIYYSVGQAVNPNNPNDPNNPNNPENQDDKPVEDTNEED